MHASHTPSRARRAPVVRFALAIAAATALSGCASGARPVSLAGTPRDARVSTSSSTDRIGAEELALAGGRSALVAVRRLRPQFLRDAPHLAGAASLAVFENETHLGGVEQLDAVPIATIIEIRRLRESEARLLLGSRCPCTGGAIVVRTRR